MSEQVPGETVEAAAPPVGEDRLSALETEAARLRSGNETLKAAMRVLLAD